MKTFKEWQDERWTPEKTSGEWSDLPATITPVNLPEHVLVDATKPSRMWIEIQFWRDIGSRAPQPGEQSHLHLQIPCGKGHPLTTKEARALAMQIVKNEKGRYTRVGVYDKYAYVGKGIFNEENNLKFYEGYKF